MKRFDIIRRQEELKRFDIIRRQEELKSFILSAVKRK